MYCLPFSYSIPICLVCDGHIIVLKSMSNHYCVRLSKYENISHPLYNSTVKKVLVYFSLDLGHFDLLLYLACI